MVQAGVKLMIFSGGEPTIFKGLPELIHRAAKESGCEHNQTNAIQLRRREFALKLAKRVLKPSLVFTAQMPQSPTI